MTEQRKKLMGMLAAVVGGLSNLNSNFFPRPRRLRSVTSPTAPRLSTTRWSARPCCGRWRRASAKPGRRTRYGLDYAYGVLSGYMISEAYGAQSQAAE